MPIFHRHLYHVPQRQIQRQIQGRDTQGRWAPYQYQNRVEK